MISLVFHKKGKALFKYPITKKRLSIGRDPACDIVLSDEDVSRLHCEIYKKDGYLQVKNLGKNGIFVNGEQTEKADIKDGDQLRLGDWSIKLSRDRSRHRQTTVAKDKDATKIIGFDDDKKIITFEAIELTIKTPDKKRTTRKFNKAKINIGSAESNDLVIENDDYVSRKHCKLAFENDDLFLIDLGSTNRTCFEGEEIDKIALSKQSRFKIGKTQIIVKRIEEKEKLKTKDDYQMGHMIGTSDAMKEIFALIHRVAPTDATVCITGESGTGKELVAQSIHDLSGRSKGPFVAINCGAIPPNIIESELFGHEKGAFTGASTTHRGVFEQADTGTLFLDEIGEMPPDLQTRLLRALETKTIKRIGGLRDINVDVRIIAATNQNIKQNVITGKFREDLFFRLYIIPIHIPPLRERIDDISILAKHFTKMFSTDGEEIPISPKVMKEFKAHNWAGNVRELKNTMQRAVILNKGGSIAGKDINLTNLKNVYEPGFVPLISQEKEAILEAIRRAGGNQSKASDILGIARTTLANKIRKYEIDLNLITIK